MKISEAICNSVDVSLKENSIKAVIAFIVSILFFGAAYFLVFSIISLARGYAFIVYPVFFGLFYIFILLLYGLALLVYLLYTHRYAVLGHIFYFFREPGKIAVMSLMFFVVFFVIGIGAFVPYYIFADKIEEIEIFNLVMDYDIKGLQNLDHGFSLEFYVSAGFWFFLLFMFFSCFCFVPNLIYDNREKSLGWILSRNFKFLRGRFLTLMWSCVKASKLSLFVFLLSYGIVLGSTKVPVIRSIAGVAGLAYPVALVYCFLIFLFCFSALYDLILNKNESLEETGVKSVADRHESGVSSQSEICLSEDNSDGKN